MFKYYLEETIKGQKLKKKKWVETTFDKITNEGLEKIFKMYKFSYDYVGIRYTTPELLRQNYKLLMLIDVDKDDMPDAIIVYKKTHCGKKIVLGATDNSGLAKRALITRTIGLLYTKPWYVEASDRLGEILDKNKRINIIKNYDDIKYILKKDFKLVDDKGNYSREVKKIGNKTKKLYGKPVLKKQ